MENMILFVYRRFATVYDLAGILDLQTIYYHCKSKSGILSPLILGRATDELARARAGSYLNTSG